MTQNPSHDSGNPEPATENYQQLNSGYAGSYQQNQAGQGQQESNYQYTQPLPAQASFPEEEQPHKKHTTKVLLASAALAALIGGGVGAGASSFSSGSSTASLSTSHTGTTIVNNTDSVNEITAAAAKATPSVVTIGVVSGSSSGSGSGIILDSQGHILTNTHVVTLDGQSTKASIEVQLSNGTVREAEIVGTDPTSDLAVIKIDTSGLELTPATLGDSDKLNVGDTSIAIGAPLGLENTVTDGIISTLSRTIEIASSEASDQQADSSDSFGSQESPFEFQMPGESSQRQSSSSQTISINVLQTDAAVNPGNSGGALVNSKGEVIGVNVAIASTDSSSSSGGNIGVGFAIPINYAQRIAKDLIDNGEASHGMLGASVSTSPANDDASQVFGDGARIEEVNSGGPAQEAGLKSGDVITSFDGKPISEASELTAAVRQVEPGTSVKVTVNRGSSSQEFEVTLGDSADS